jgi:hypothetical protein
MSTGAPVHECNQCAGSDGTRRGEGDADSCRLALASRKTRGEARRDIRPSASHDLAGAAVTDPPPRGRPVIQSGWASMPVTVQGLVAASVLLGAGALAAVVAEPLLSGAGAQWAANVGWTLGGMTRRQPHQ